MSAYVPSFAPIAVLAFLGTAAALLLCLLIALYGLARKSGPTLAIAGLAGVFVLAAYGGILLGFSLFSHEVELSAGSKKYFCEIDCHISYEVERVWMPSMVGGESSPIASNGKFVVVELRTWFDPTTISPWRGDAPLTPNGRATSVRDKEGRLFAPSARAEQVLAALGLHSIPLATALRPGQSYISYLVFEVPASADGLKLWLRSTHALDALLWGDERSLWHGKVLFLLNPAPVRAKSSL